MAAVRSITAICDDLQELLAKPLQEPGAAFALAEEIADHPDGIRALALLLLLLEKNEELDWGSPGPVVHAAERFFNKGYEALLLESVVRAPTSHTLWMAYRVANGVPEDRQEQYLSAIRGSATRTDVSQAARDAAKDLLAGLGDEDSVAAPTSTMDDNSALEAASRFFKSYRKRLLMWPFRWAIGFGIIAAVAKFFPSLSWLWWVEGWPPSRCSSCWLSATSCIAKWLVLAQAWPR